MSFTSLFRCLTRVSERNQEGRVGHRHAHRKPAPGLRSFLPRLEALEDRTTPSTLTVMNNADDGAGSLRRAIHDAHSGDTIDFAIRSPRENRMVLWRRLWLSQSGVLKTNEC